MDMGDWGGGGGRGAQKQPTLSDKFHVRTGGGSFRTDICLFCFLIKIWRILLQKCYIVFYNCIYFYFGLGTGRIFNLFAFVIHCFKTFSKLVPYYLLTNSLHRYVGCVDKVFSYVRTVDLCVRGLITFYLRRLCPCGNVRTYVLLY